MIKLSASCQGECLIWLLWFLFHFGSIITKEKFCDTENASGPFHEKVCRSVWKFRSVTSVVIFALTEHHMLRLGKWRPSSFVLVWQGKSLPCVLELMEWSSKYTEAEKQIDCSQLKGTSGESISNWNAKRVFDVLWRAKWRPPPL